MRCTCGGRTCFRGIRIHTLLRCTAHDDCYYSNNLILYAYMCIKNKITHQRLQ